MCRVLCYLLGLQVFKRQRPLPQRSLYSSKGEHINKQYVNDIIWLEAINAMEILSCRERGIRRAGSTGYRVKGKPRLQRDMETKVLIRAGSAMWMLGKGFPGGGDTPCRGPETEHVRCSRRPVWLGQHVREGPSHRGQTTSSPLQS